MRLAPRIFEHRGLDGGKRVNKRQRQIISCEGALPTLQHLNLPESYGVGYKSYTEQYLDSTGIFKDAVISILAKQERVRLSERTKAGIERAKSKGTKLGKLGLEQESIEQIRRLKSGGLSNYAIGKALKLSATTVAKYVE